MSVGRQEGTEAKKGTKKESEQQRTNEQTNERFRALGSEVSTLR